MTALTPERVIELLELEPLPVEGGYFRRTYTSADSVNAEALPARYSSAKSLLGIIYYLLGPGDFSALHRLRTDEIYHFYLGDPVELLLLYPDGQTRLETLGQALEQGQRLQAVVPRGVWQGSRLLQGGWFALLGTSMAPAYDQDDFELGHRAELIAEYSAQAQLIRALTR